MLEITCSLKGIAPLQFSKYIAVKRNTGELHDAFERRTWIKRLHVGVDGGCFIPPAALKGCLTNVAKFLSESVPGKGKATYTKHFRAGVMCTEPMVLLNAENGKVLRPEDAEALELFVPASGRSGDGKRVMKTFPVFPSWRTIARIHVLDPLLIDIPDKIEEYLRHSGQFIGIGTFRPENGGHFGRFIVEEFESKRIV